MDIKTDKTGDVGSKKQFFEKSNPHQKCAADTITVSSLRI